MAILDKIVYAGVNNTSFAQGSQDLAKLAEIEVSVKQVERVCQRIGDERTAERDEAVAAYQALPLTKRKEVPAGVTAPALAVVGCDGGRLQILERGRGATVEAEPASDAEDGSKSQHWREDKIGLLMTMDSEVAASDPCPEIPEHFVDLTRILKLARELKKQALPSEEAVKETSAPELGVETLAEERASWEPPEVQTKHLTASRHRFARTADQAARERPRCWLKEPGVRARAPACDCPRPARPRTTRSGQEPPTATPQRQCRPVSAGRRAPDRRHTRR